MLCVCYVLLLEAQAVTAMKGCMTVHAKMLSKLYFSAHGCLHAHCMLNQWCEAQTQHNNSSSNKQ
jgi:hypothetical protein